MKEANTRNSYSVAFETDNANYYGEQALDQVASLGAGPQAAIDTVTSFGVTDRDTFAEIVGNADGTLSINLGQQIVDANDANHISQLLHHESGHAFDGMERQFYSSADEMKVKLFPNGGVIPIGKVAKELHNLFRTNPLFKQGFTYPFSPSEAIKLGAELDVQAEMFAQAFVMFANPDLRAILKTSAPETFAFIEKAINDANQNPTQYFEAVRERKQRVSQQAKDGKSASAEPSGQESAANRDSKAGAITSTPPAKKLSRWVARLVHRFRPNLLGVMFAHDLVEYGKKYLPSMEKFFNTLSKKLDERIQQSGFLTSPQALHTAPTGHRCAQQVGGLGRVGA